MSLDQASLLKAAQQAAPEMIEKVAHILHVLEKSEPFFADELKNDIRNVLDFATEKTAAPLGGQAPGMGGFGMALGGTLLAGLGASIATDLYDASKRGLTKGRNFRMIMKANPELAELEGVTPSRLRASYNAIHQFAPEFTSDPVVGGALLKTMATQPTGSEHQQIMTLMQARKNLQEAKHKQYSPHNVQVYSADNSDDQRHKRAIELANHQHDLKTYAQGSPRHQKQS